MASLPEDDVPTMTSVDLRKEVEKATGAASAPATVPTPIDGEEEERTATHVLELVESTALDSSSVPTVGSNAIPNLDHDALEDSITATAPTIDPQTRSPILDALKLNAVKIAMPAVDSPRPPSLPPVPPRPAAPRPAPPTQLSPSAKPEVAPIDPPDETEARTVPGREPADDEPPTAQGLTAPVVSHAFHGLPTSLVPSTEPAIDDEDEDPTAHGFVISAAHPADQDDAPTGVAPAPAPVTEPKPHPADEDDAPTGQGPAPAVTLKEEGEAYEPDDSITGLSPNISKLSLSQIAAGAVAARADGELPDLTEGTTSKMKLPKPPPPVKPVVAESASPAEDESDSVTTQAPGQLTNMLRVIAADGAPQRTKPMPAVLPLEDDDLPRDKTAVMAGAPMRAVARPERPTSDSGMRARADSTSGERSSAPLAPSAGFPSAAPSEPHMPVPSSPGSARTHEPPPPWDLTAPASPPRYGWIVGFSVSVAIAFPVMLWFVLSSRSPAPALEAAPSARALDVPKNPLVAPPRAKATKHAPPPPPPSDLASASSSAKVSAPAPRKAPRRWVPRRRGPRRR